MGFSELDTLIGYLKGMWMVAPELILCDTRSSPESLMPD